MSKNEAYSLMDNDFVLALTCIVYVFILVFGLVGNLRLSCSVSSEMSKRTVVNVFMSNIAVANILLCLFVLPTFPVYLIMKIWPSCYFICHLWPFVYYSLRYASLLTLASISLFQCSSTIHSEKLRITRVKSFVIVTIVWLASFIISLPREIFDHQENIGYNNNSRFYLCPSGWSSDSSRENKMTTFIIMMVVPLIAFVHSFVAFSFKLLCMSTLKTTRLNAQHTMAITIRLMVTVAVVCGICWMPIGLSQAVHDNSKSRLTVIALGVVDVIAMSSVCFTPLFYMWLNGITIKQFLLPGQWINYRSLQSNNVEL